MPAILWATVLNNATDATIGHSFVNQLLELDPISENWIMKKISSVEALRRDWLKDDKAVQGSFMLCLKKTVQYGLTIKRFLELLLFLVYILYGQPAQGLELLTIQHRNTANGRLRNIIIDRRMVMLIMGYYKGFLQSE